MYRIFANSAHNNYEYMYIWLNLFLGRFVRKLTQLYSIFSKTFCLSSLNMHSVNHSHTSTTIYVSFLISFSSYAFHGLKMVSEDCHYLLSHQLLGWDPWSCQSPLVLHHSGYWSSLFQSDTADMFVVPADSCKIENEVQGKENETVPS